MLPAGVAPGSERSGVPAIMVFDDPLTRADLTKDD